MRGDPDGLEGTPMTFTSNSDVQRVDLPAEDILHLKKGWLMKQGIGQVRDENESIIRALRGIFSL